MTDKKEYSKVIYTKGGDKGMTSLYDGTRVGKDDIRVDTYGTVDELGAYLGLAICFLEDEPDLAEEIRGIQNQLFVVNHNLATADPAKIKRRIQEEEIVMLEKLVDKYMEKAGKFDGFIINGTSKPAAILHIARTVCRRAERRVVGLAREVEVDPLVVKFINRLSDTLYAFARYCEVKIIDVDWEGQMVIK